MNVTSEEVCGSTKMLRKASASSSRSDSATERCRQELDDYDVNFDVRPPSGTNHQQPGKHLSIDTRFAELSLENASFIAESEREPYTLQSGRNGTVGSFFRHKNKPDRVQVPKGNFYIASPFKQGPEKDAKGPTSVVDPSHDLKQRTIAGVTKVRRQLENEKRTRHLKLHQSQLQRGNLRPLGRPMTASGPGMRNCQGIVAGSRSYHGFTRRQTKNLLQDGKRQVTNSDDCLKSNFKAIRNSPNQKPRPEGSVHNTSFASCANAANDDSDGSFSEDESEDSVDVEKEGCDFREGNKVDPSEMDLRNLSAGNGCNPKLNNTCKPYLGYFDRKGPHSDDDSDEDEGRWAAEQTDPFVRFRGGEGHGNGPKTEKDTTGKNSSGSQGKQNSFRGSGDEQNRRSSYDLNDAKDLVDYLNISASTRSRQKTIKSTRGRLPIDSGLSEERKVTEPLSSHSCANAHKVIDVHITVSGRQRSTTEMQHATMMGRCATTEGHIKTMMGQCATVEGQHATMMGQSATRDGHCAIIEDEKRTKTEGHHVTTEGRNEYFPRYDKNAEIPLHDIGKDFAKDSGDLLESDALDSDRIPSADIFRVLDKLNLSTSAMKPPTPLGDRSRSRRVQSAGHTRRKPLGKRPASAKQAERKKNQNNDFHDSSEINTTSPAFGRAEGLTKHKSEKIPGYFTEEYKKILEKKNERSEQMSNVKTDAASSSSLSLVHVPRDLTETRSTSSDDEKGGKQMQTKLSSNEFKENKRFPEIPNSERTDPDKTKYPGKKRENDSDAKNNSRSSLSGVFVTTDDKSELRSVCDVEVSSSGVETMSCGTDCSSFERFGDAMNKSSYNINQRECTQGGGEGEDDLYCDIIDCVDDDDDDDYDDDDTGGGESFNDNFHDDGSNLEVVAKPKRLSESRYLKQKNSIAPFPPVCFSINARPPEGYLYYFAYGHDMNPNRMAIYLRREPKTRLWGILFGFQLLFNKRGTSKEAGGFPNIQFNPEHAVEGCVYAITVTELAMLDNCMGYPKHYTHAVFPVWMLNSTSPSQHGVAQFCVPAVLYVAQNEWVINDSSQKLDCSYSVSQCIKASDILTPNYVEFLSSQAES